MAFVSQNRIRLMVGAGVWLMLTLMCVSAHASVVTLTDGSAVGTYDIDGASPGMSLWAVDGVTHLAAHGLWVRVGNTAEIAVGSLSLVGYQMTDTNFNFQDDTLSLRYRNDVDNYVVDVELRLDGSSSESTIFRQVRIINEGTGTLDMHLFEYFDYASAGPTEYARIENANTIVDSGSAYILAETSMTSGVAPDKLELGDAAALLAMLTDGVPDELAGDGVGTEYAGIDGAWAAQWDVTLAPVGTGGESFVTVQQRWVSTPEPSMLIILAVGGIGALRRRLAR